MKLCHERISEKKNKRSALEYVQTSLRLSAILPALITPSARLRTRTHTLSASNSINEDANARARAREICIHRGRGLLQPASFIFSLSPFLPSARNANKSLLSDCFP